MEEKLVTCMSDEELASNLKARREKLDCLKGQVEDTEGWVMAAEMELRFRVP